MFWTRKLGTFGHKAPPRRRRTRLALEALEDRCVPATVQNFDFAGAGSVFVPQQVNNPPGPTVLPGGPTGFGRFLRLAPGAPNPAPPAFNTLTFAADEEQPFSRVVADFDFRITPGNGRGDGFGFSLLNATDFPGPSVGGTAEEPNFANSLGVGFDVFKNDNLGDIGNTNIAPAFSNSISIHYDGQVLAQFDASAAADLAGSRWLHARVDVEVLDGSAAVSVTLTPCNENSPVTIVDRFSVQGFVPYRPRVHFGARSGGETADHDLDNINVQSLQPGESVVSFSSVVFAASETGGEAVVTLNRLTAPGPVVPPGNVTPYGFGDAGWIPVVGDWDGDGIETVGAFDPATATWHLRNSNSPGPADVEFNFGFGTWTPVVGDWDGDGIDTIGMVDTTGTSSTNGAWSVWYLRNANSSGAPDVADPFPFGLANPSELPFAGVRPNPDPDRLLPLPWQPVVGDWDGDGVDTVGIVDTTGASSANGFFAVWYLRNSNRPGVTDVTDPFPFGLINWKPVTGDWNGDGIDTPGSIDPSNTSNARDLEWYLRPNNNFIGDPSTVTQTLYGFFEWFPVPGDWNVDGATDFGVVDLTASVAGGPTNLWYPDLIAPDVELFIDTSIRSVDLGTATPGSDFTDVLVGVRFGPGETTQTVSIPILDDSALEGDEAFLVRLRNTLPNTLIAGPDAAAVTLLDDEDGAINGHWSGPLCWPVLAINMIALPTGEVLFYDRFGETRIWNPSTGRLTDPAQPGYNTFCSGHAFLPDGTLLVAGGHLPDGDPANDGVGIPNASIYNPFTDEWTPLPDMNAGRWYPTVTTLANGDLLVLSGSVDTAFTPNRLPQVWQRATRAWRDLTDAQDVAPFGVDLYPRLFLTPDGRVYKVGADQDTWFLDTTGTGAWTQGPDRVFGLRTYGAAVMYEPGKILVVGGGQDPATATAEVIDLNDANPTWRAVGSMAFARRHLNATVLPDGKVLVTGGVDGAGFNDEKAPILPAELWDPATGNWTTLDAHLTTRGYHSSAVLLPDGRVVSAGGGEGAGATGQHTDAEVYSPPYLFQGSRPTITAAPGGAEYGATVVVETPDAATISKVSLVRLGAATHAFDQNQRYVPLPYTATSGGLEVTLPGNPNDAPPGHYLLFILDGDVPSEGQIVQLS